MAKLVNERSDVLPVLVEVFREHGYDGTSLSVIGERTGLGKGSLYNFFPGGKEEMARAVLAEIAGWFERAVFAPLRSSADPQVALGQMFDGVVEYFQSGRRACLVGAFALASSRDLFGTEIESYFKAWRDDLKRALVRRGSRRKEAAALTEETLAAIQGALVLARALDEPQVFSRSIARLRKRLAVSD